MIRISAIVIGVALAVFWAVGLKINRHAVMLWFDAVAAVISFGVAALEDEERLGTSRALAPAVLGLGLAALWIGGLASRQPRWAAWANFVAAAAYLLVAVLSTTAWEQRVLATRRHHRAAS